MHDEDATAEPAAEATAMAPSSTVPAWSDNARVVLEKRYLRRDGDGALVETASELLPRVAHALAAVDAAYGEDPALAEARFRGPLERLELLPNSPTLMNAGLPQGQLSACFVVPVEDSLAEIFDAVKAAALIQQTGGGTGFSFSRLRPAGDRVASSRGVAAGPLPFIEVFNAASEAIRQGGARAGANMALLRVDHPDVIEFIAAKSDPARLRNFNVSVAITDAFMAAVEAGGDYGLRDPRHGRELRRLDARRVIDLLAAMAWRSGEPGVVFIDRVNAANPTPALGAMEATNPCGELPLLPWEACNLASIDVGKFVDEHERDFDWQRLSEVIDIGIHLLDNVIDANHYPRAEIAAVSRGNRKVGLGVMGFADALIRLGVRYDSDEGVAAAERLMAFVSMRSFVASAELARRRGAFPNFPGSRWDGAHSPPRRNATTTTIAPTGTLSLLAGCSAGIEPLYGVAFTRHVLDGERLLEVHPRFVERGRREGWWSAELATRLGGHGGARGLDGVPEAVQALFATAHDIAPIWHLRMQAAFQRHVHNAVSKTINLPREATVGDVATIFREGYRLGVKGVTVYRDGSRAAQVLSVGEASRPPAPPCPSCGAALPPPHGGCTVCSRCAFSGGD